MLEGGCVPFGGERLPFGPIVEAFRDIPQTFSPSDLDELLGAGSRDLARLVPGLPRVHDETRSGLADNDPGQGQLFEHVLGFLRRLAGAQPVVVVVEDIHWADRSTLELLAFLARNLREGSIVVLASYRTDELHRDHPLRPFLVEQERAGRFEHVELNRFDRSELADQLAAILGAPADAELVGGIMGRSQGNAFYAEELLAATSANGGVADSLRDVVLARVASLSQPTQALVRVAAAGGTRVSPTLLARVWGTPIERLEVALREAIDRYILAPNERHGDDRYVFRHALVQEVLYRELCPANAFDCMPDLLARSLPHGIRRYRLARGRARVSLAGGGHLPRAFDAWIEAGIAAEALYCRSRSP